MTVASLSLADGSNFDEEIGGASPGTGGAGGYDQTIVQNGGTVTLGGATLNLSLVNGFTPSIGETFTIIKNETGSAVTGTYANLSQGTVFSQGGVHFLINYASGSGDDVVLTVAGPTIGDTSNITAQFYQGQASAAVLDNNITVADATGANVTRATVTITNANGASVSGDTLQFVAQNGITEASFSNGVLTLIGSASAADYQAALRSIAYTFVGDPTDDGTAADKTRTITWSVSDADSLTSASGSATTLDVYMTPVLAGSPTTTPTITSTSGAVTADANLTVTDHNTFGTAPAATVSISGAPAGDEFFIPAADLTAGKIAGTTISVSGNDSSSLTLTGTSSTTTAQFKNALDEVQFDAASPNNGTRTLTWVFNDDAGGNANDSNSFTTSVDVAFGPQITALVGPAVNGGTVELQVTGINVGDTINLYADGNTNTIVGTGTVVAGGPFDITTSGTFADGVYTFVAQETNNPDPSLPESQPFTVDVDPNAPSISMLVGQPVNGDKVELQGTGETLGDTIDLYADGNNNTIVGTGTVGVGGAFDITTTATFADSVHTFTATETDLSNLTSAQSSPALTVDVDPNAPSITTLVGQPLNGGTVDLQGSGETAGDTIDLYADGNTTIVGTGTVKAGGSFDITTTATFADGVHTFTATEVDAANLTSASSSPGFTVDVDPTAPSITTLVGQPLTGQTVELQGTGEVGDRVDLYADGNGNMIVGSGVVGAGGTFDITTTATFGTGTHTFTATEIDAAPLTSAVSTPAFQVTVVHQPPAITAGGTATFGGAGPVALDAGVMVNDVDSGGDLAGRHGDDQLRFVAGDTLEIGGQTNGTITDSRRDDQLRVRGHDPDAFRQRYAGRLPSRAGCGHLQLQPVRRRRHGQRHRHLPHHQLAGQ